MMYVCVYVCVCVCVYIYRVNPRYLLVVPDVDHMLHGGEHG